MHHAAELPVLPSPSLEARSKWQLNTQERKIGTEEVSSWSARKKWPEPTRSPKNTNFRDSFEATYNPQHSRTHFAPSEVRSKHYEVLRFQLLSPSHAWMKTETRLLMVSLPTWAARQFSGCWWMDRYLILRQCMIVTFCHIPYLAAGTFLNFVSHQPAERLLQLRCANSK